MNQLYLRVQGPNAQQLSEELAKLIEQELGKQPAIPTTTTDDPHKGIDFDTVQNVILVLKIINKTLKISDRIKHSQAFQIIINWCQEKSISNPEDTIQIPTEQGYKDLGHVEPADIFRALETYRT